MDAEQQRYDLHDRTKEYDLRMAALATKAADYSAESASGVGSGTTCE